MSDLARVPRRIQRKRTKGWRIPDGAVYVGRPTRWGNPWKVDPQRATDPPSNECRATAAEAVDAYRNWVVYAAPFTVDDVRSELAGRDLACWCPPDQPCHADVLLELANDEIPDRCVCEPIPPHGVAYEDECPVHGLDHQRVPVREGDDG